MTASPDAIGGAAGRAARRRAAAQVFVEDPASPVLSPDDVHHLSRVLRLAPGEVVVAADGRGSWSCCRYRGDGTIEVDGPVEVEPAPAPALTLAFTPVKAARPEWVVQKLTELGVDRIVLLSTARSVVRWDAPRTAAMLVRLGRVAVEAAAQSRRAWLPELSGVVALESLEPEGMALAEPGGPAMSVSVTGVAVGPEGGWSPEELSSGWPTVGVGTQVLRAETAALAAAVLLGAQRAGTVSGHQE